MVPVSVRTADQHGALGNQVSSMMAPLPVSIEDPVERLQRVSQLMGDLKSSKQAMGATVMTQLADFAPPTISAQAARLQSRQRFFNLVVTNVPGPQFPLYLLGPQAAAHLPDGPPGAAPGASASGSCPTTARSTSASSATTTRWRTSTTSDQTSTRRSSELVEAAGGQRGFLRRFVPGSERDEVAARTNGAGTNGSDARVDREEPASE